MRRDINLAKERLNITYKSLVKHDQDSIEEPGCWGWIPKSVFNCTISSQAYGLLVMLAMNAATPPVSNRRNVVSRIVESTILKWLGFENSNRRSLITQLLDELEEQDIIKRCGDEIELIFPNIKDVSGGFCKLYTSTYKAILDHSHGIATLNRLSVYLGIRARIFEGEIGGPSRTVVYEGRANPTVGYFIDLPSATVRNIVHWFIDNKIMSWNLVQNRNKYHNRHYYLAEHFNRDELVSMICKELQSGELLRVIA